MKEQRRGRKIAMSSDEVVSFLSEERTCRVSTIGAGGAPHTSALWFVWDTHSLWLTPWCAASGGQTSSATAG